MPLYDYRDGLGHVTEAIRPSDVHEIPCPRCGEPAERIAANRVAMGFPTVDSRGMFRRFTEASAEMEHAASSYEQRTGQAAPDDGLWQAAKQRAAAIERAGENPLRPIRET